MFFDVQLPEFPLSYRTRCWIAHPCTSGHVVDGTIHLTSDREGHLPIETLSLLYLTPQSWLHREGRKARLGAVHGQCHQVSVVPWTKSGASLKHNTIQHYYYHNATVKPGVFSK